MAHAGLSSKNDEALVGFARGIIGLDISAKERLALVMFLVRFGVHWQSCIDNRC